MQPTILFLLAVLVSRAVAQDDPYRLPPNYVINHYDIDLTVPAESFTSSSSNYSGYVEIQFQVTINTSEVKLHSSYSYIQLLTIQLNDEEVLTTEDYSVNSTTNILTLQFDKELITGQNYTLKFAFNARLLSSSGGFYKASYTDEYGEVQYIATTQFESTDARYAFPCFDEPRYKATFAYNLTHPSNMTAITNTPALSNATNPETNLTTTTQFGVSPRMPVYLVAFIISKYTCSEGVLEGSLVYRHQVCSRQDRAYRRNFTMEVTPLVIDYLNSYTGINYTDSISKLTQVAVSGKSGAMENWGLVLYSESGLLFDNTIQTNANKQSILAVIAHELAHQWFGNLVTCKWWSEIFLNEGFATMFEYYTSNAVLPEFEMEKQFVIRILQSILTTDGNLNVPALRSNASTPTEISAKFGSYSYRKGGSVLRMVEHFLGREQFRAGIKKYLTDNAYQPAEPEDLWNALTNANDNELPYLPLSTTLSKVMFNWINNPGYPVLNVSLVDTNIIMSQQRFLYSGSDNESTWYIPVSYTTGETGDFNEITTPRGWATPTNDFVITGFSNASEWIVVNNQQTGFYRVNYDDTLWENLAIALLQSNFSGINVLNRAQIIEDSYMLARAGYLSFGRVLRNSEFLVSDTSYFTWYPAISFFSYLLSRTGSMTPLGAAVTNHLMELIAAAAESVPLTTVDEAAHIFTLNQILINNYACKYGNTVCVNAAKQLFATYKNSYERPNINTRSIVYCNAIRHSDDPMEDWNFLYEQYQNSSESTDSSTIWSALGCATSTTVLNSFLSKTITGDIAATLYTSVFSAIYSANEIGVDIALDFFIDNFQNISNTFTTARIGTVLTGMGSYFTKTSQIEKLENFMNTTEVSSIIATYVNSSLTTARSNQEIINTHRSSLNEYFALSDEEETTSNTISTTTSITTPITTLSTSPTATSNDDPITTSSTASSTSSATASSDVSTTTSSSTTTTSTAISTTTTSTITPTTTTLATTPTSITTTEATTTAEPGNGSEKLGRNGLMSLVLLAIVNIFFARF